jgi:dihydroneopterin aldolase
MTHLPRFADAGARLRHVFLRDMVLLARIGVHPFEREPQRIRLNVDLSVVDDFVLGREELASVVDYEAVANRIRAIVAEGHVRLVETLAERIAAACLADPRVLVARVRVEKPDILPDTASVGVEIERRAGPAA